MIRIIVLLAVFVAAAAHGAEKVAVAAQDGKKKVSAAKGAEKKKGMSLNSLIDERIALVSTPT